MRGNVGRSRETSAICMFAFGLHLSVGSLAQTTLGGHLYDLTDHGSAVNRMDHSSLSFTLP